MQTGLGEVVNSRITWVTNRKPVSTCPPFRNPHSKKQTPPPKQKSSPKHFKIFNLINLILINLIT